LIKSESLNTFLHLFYQKMILIDIFSKRSNRLRTCFESS
jgi:hypothetical protein